MDPSKLAQIQALLSQVTTLVQECAGPTEEPTEELPMEESGGEDKMSLAMSLLGEEE